jgi:hypothetical protein
MNTATAYTPLESLLLFQSLSVFGTDPNTFLKISDLLKNNVLVRDGDSYDPGRLSPDALRELYLQLLRDESRSEIEAQAGDISPSKKRKIPTPALPTIKDAKEYSEKLPQLVDRLYARYRDHAIRSIRDDERRWTILQREIKEIERGEWDEKILKGERQESQDVRRSTSAPKSSPRLDRPLSKEGESKAKQLPSPSASPRIELKPEGLAISDVLNSRDSLASPRISEKDSISRVRNGSQGLPPLNHNRAGSIERPHGPSPLQPGHIGIPGQPPQPGHTGQPAQPPAELKWESYQGGPTHGQPQLPHQPQNAQPQYSPHHPPQGYSQYPPQYPPYPPNSRGPFPGPLPATHSQLPSSPHAASHPIVLPPPNVRPSSSQAMPLDALTDVADQQYHPQQSPIMMPQPPYPQQFPLYPAPPQQLPQQHANNGRPPSSAHPQWSHPYPQPPYPQAQNFPYPSPQPVPRPFAATPNIPQPERQYNSPYNPSHARAPEFKSTPVPKPLLKGSIPNTPVTRLTFSTGRSTKWMSVASPATPTVPRSPPHPVPEPLSPVIAPATIVKGKKLGRNQQKRAESIVSTISHGDELSLVAEPIVKKESTPSDEIGDTTADESRPPQVSPHRKRKRTPLNEPSAPPTHVLWTRNFPKICGSALGRIDAHRNASTFAKPINERDAPGYKNVILRPQDLKSIRSAVNAGNKAAQNVAATMEDKGQASMLLPISEDLVPPKGIINNAQLEKELMLMFANAVMFNPDPDRGFGPSFPVGHRARSGGENYDVDENGVVKDTKAMFADVEKIVGEMRIAERRKSEETREREREKEKERSRERDAGDEMDVDELAGDGEIHSKKRRRA